MRAIATLLLLLLAGSTAQASCESVPAPIQHFLATHREWKLVTVATLVIDDQRFWQQRHRGLCPGYAEADLDGSGKKTYAIALIHRIDDQTHEQLVALRPQGQKFRLEVLSGPTPVAIPLVVWKVAKPSDETDLATGRRIHIAHASFSYEEMESSATAFYWSNGSIRSAIVSQ